MDPIVVGGAIVTAATFVGGVIAVVIKKLRDDRGRAKREDTPLPTPIRRENTGRHHIVANEEDLMAHIFLIRETVLRLSDAWAEQASDRAREYVHKETVARLTELVEQLYTSYQRRTFEQEHVMRRMESMLKQLLEEVRARNNAFGRED